MLLLESTYGDRLHPADDDGERLAEVIRTTIDRRGKVIVPSFAIGRVEEVLYWVKRLEEEGRIPVVPVYVDSPMAHEALNFYSRRTDELDDEMSQRGRAVRMFATKRFTVTRSAQESKQITASKLPVDRHLVERAWRPAAASCTTWPTACPTSATPCCSSASRPRARAAGSWSTAPPRSRSTAGRSR